MTGPWQTKTDPGNGYPSHTPAEFERGSCIPESSQYLHTYTFIIQSLVLWAVKAKEFNHVTPKLMNYLKFNR